MGDILIAAPLIILILLPFILLRMWRWVGLFLIIAAYEGILALTTHETLSQEWWRLSRGHNLTFLTILLILAWGGLLLHLWWKKLKGRK